MKMAYASLPKFVPINSSNMCPDNITKIPLSEVLQSDPVKRLLNQPNIIIKTIPLSSVTQLDKDIIGNKRNGMNVATLDNTKSPTISIIPVRIPNEERDDANLLPSKIEDKKSEIALLPIKKKLCGHYEPCENIVCDVIVQQYVDNDEASPMLAINIKEEEINAPVGKHCKNEYCDALSIDHNRCRRASINLYRCDKSRVCDICGVTLEGWKSRMYHRNCMRKNEYRHNNVDRAHLLKERMRERELQILEIAKMKRNDYSDPVKAMETLRKNDEIIIIPKTTPSQKPIITITSIPTTQSIGTNVSNAQPIKISSQGNNFANIFGNVPFTISPQSTSHSIESKTQPINQVGFSNLQQKSYMTSTSSTSTSVPASVTTSVPVPSSQNQYICLATCSSQTTTIQPLTINSWAVSPSHVLTTTPINKSFWTPIRVVPITNLITAPSLLHRTQGIPKFCIMAENVVTPVTVSNSLPLQSVATSAVNTSTTATTLTTTTTTANITITITTSSTATTMQEKDVLKVPIQHYSMQKGQKGQKILKTKKTFFCDYCSKHFSTDWYFKMHIAKHKGVKLFFCNLCDESFSNKYDMKKHMAKQHNDQKEMFTMQQSKEFTCNECDYVCKSFAFFKNHIKSHATSNSDKDVKLKKQKLKSSEEKINHTTSVHDLNIKNEIKEEMKEINCQDTPSDLNKNKVSIIETTTEDNIKIFQNIIIKNEDDIELSTINENTDAKMNGFAFVSKKNSLEENLDSKNYKQESIIMS